MKLPVFSCADRAPSFDFDSGAEDFDTAQSEGPVTSDSKTIAAPATNDEYNKDLGDVLDLVPPNCAVSQVAGSFQTKTGPGSFHIQSNRLSSLSGTRKDVVVSAWSPSSRPRFLRKRSDDPLPPSSGASDADAENSAFESDEDFVLL